LALFTDKIISNVTLDVDSILRDLSGGTRSSPSMMQQQPEKVDGDDQ